MASKQKRYQAIQEYRSKNATAETPLLSEKEKKYDPNASTEDLIADLRGVQERHPDTYITRRFYRQHGRYSDSTWDSKFGTFAEYRRQARLELSRGQSQLEKQVAKHASLDARRGFYEVEVLPWNNKFEHDLSGRWQTMMVASDFHDKETDPFALEVFLETCKSVQPSVICLAGDVYDHYEFSRFDKDPRGWDAAGRLAWVRDNLFRPLRSLCPDSQVDLLAGNHEHHLLRHMAERTPELRTILSDFMGLSFADLLGLREFEINLVCKHDLAAFKAADIRREIAKNRKTYWGCVTVDHYPDPKFGWGTNWLAGHTHKPSLQVHSNEILGGVWGYTNGCMCRIDNAYTDRNRNQNSFALVHVDTQKHLAQLEPIIFNDEFVTVAGKRYVR